MYLKRIPPNLQAGRENYRGLLLTSQPGTGKTLPSQGLLQEEADVSLLYCSGGQFEEVYVGLGAKRIRELFRT
jgi:ATP-dependent Zn protease